MELIQQFDLLASSLGGVAKLRELILSLAVRGKLVPQNPADEPASMLLQKIRAEKERLIAEGKIKKDKPLAPISDDEKPFELPKGWEWVRLADIAAVLNGRAYKQHELLEAGTPVLRVGNLFTSSHWYYSDLKLEEDKYCDVGDLLFAWSASFGPFIWPGSKAIYHYHIWKLNLHSPTHFNKQYLYTFLQEKTQELKAGGHGVSMVHMTKDSMEKTLLPVPPLPEQSRIVAKVDELMALCDRLEGEQGQAARVQGHWVEAALAQLADSADADDFARHWQHLAQHFDTLFTTPDSITQLEATLLQLAVRGKLVPQDPSDEPASTLLQKIRTEKDRLIAEGKIKKDKSLPPISDEEKPFELPKGWEWGRLVDLCSLITDGTHQTPKYVSNGKPFLSAQNVKPFRFLANDYKYVPDYVPTSATLSKVFLEQGFALMTATASLGSIATRSLRRLNRYCTSAR
jgi:type I restriction enzyme S subunit